MLINKQDIIDNALLAYGSKDPYSSSQQTVEKLYKLTSLVILGGDYWNFAQKITDLLLISETDELFNYRYKYSVPADMANMFLLYSKEGPYRDYKILNYFLYTRIKPNNTPLKCQYTSTDLEDAYPAHFADCVSYGLAVRLCVAFGASNSQSSLEAQYKQALKDARIINGRDATSATFNLDYYSRSRF